MIAFNEHAIKEVFMNNMSSEFVYISVNDLGSPLMYWRMELRSLQPLILISYVNDENKVAANEISCPIPVQYAFFLSRVIPKLVIRFVVEPHTTDIEIVTETNYLLSLLYFLKLNSLSLFQYLNDIAVVDYPGSKERFNVHYIITSLHYNSRLRICIKIHELQYIHSITLLYSNASWCEREVWDMFGIYIIGNNDLRRILTDYNFVGHPLRKDFPLSGFIEVAYSDCTHRLMYNKVSLSQEYRNFSFLNPWLKI